jgi:Zn-dependent protease/predicted transcriptional regulator
MFGKNIKLFKLFGFEVRIDASWLVIAVLITWSLASSVFPQEYRGLSQAAYWWMGACGALGLFGSIVVHELFHSLVARRYNLRMKGITLFIFGGVAEMEKEPESAKAEFMMAIAGPIASILIGSIFYVLYLNIRGGGPVQVVGIVSYLSWINWVLAAFNLIPAFPLDGGRVLRAALWQWKGNLPRATRIASSIGSGFGIALILLAVYQLISGNVVGAVWWFLIGMFLRGASQASYQQLMVRLALEGEPIRRFMRTNPVTVPPYISLEALVEEYIYRYHYKMFPVVNESQEVLGCVTTRHVKEIPREEWRRSSVQSVMEPCTPENTVGPDAGALDVLARMNKSGLSRLMVVENNRLVAVISLKDLMNFLSAKLDLEGGQPKPPAEKTA